MIDQITRYHQNIRPEILDLRARVVQLNISFETLDHVAGLPTRYCSKVLGIRATRNFGQISLDALLGATGIMLIAVEDAAALDRVRAQGGQASVGALLGQIANRRQ